MSDYDRSRRPITRSLQEQTRQAMETFLSCLFNHDVTGAAALLADDVRNVGDGGGEFIAARVPIVGREKVLLFNSRIARQKPEDVRFEWRILNGLPALVVELASPAPGYAPRWVTTCELDETGRIRQINVVLATRKMTAVRAIRS